MLSCSQSASISRSGNPAEFANVTARPTGRKARRSSGRRKNKRSPAQAVAIETPIVKLPAATSCHESLNATGLRVEPVLEITNAGRKRSAQARLNDRQVSVVKRAARCTVSEGLAQARRET